jgi:tetratricopeptide (TPR) repeat protein
MLFDLKGKRKRTVQVTYVILAILFGGSLVLFGVGSSAPGGLVDAITGNNSGGSGINTDTFERQVKKAQLKARVNPKDPKVWTDLAQAELSLARAGDDFDQQTGQFKEGAVDTVEKATKAWERHLKLKPKKPDANTAALMVQAYATLLRFSRGDPLAQFEAAAKAQEIFAKERPSPNSWFELATILYQIGKIERGDRAADKAVELTPKDQRNVVQGQIDDTRKQGLKTKRQLAKSEKQAEKAAREARKSGQDPFGATPGQSSLGQ